MHKTCILYITHKKTMWNLKTVSHVKAKKRKISFEENFMMSNAWFKAFQFQLLKSLWKQLE